MADPIIPNAVRAQCVWEAPSALPEDVFVTSWAFVRSTAGTNGGAQQQNEVAERLREFWLEPVGANTLAVADMIPVSITQRGLTIRTYDLGQAPPREPTLHEFSTTRGSSANAIPREVAICQSFYGERNLPSQRGRNYLGPLTVSVVSGDSAFVNPAWQTIIIEAASRLALGMGVGDEMEWSVLSQKNQALTRVQNGWVDNAFDTVRSRGQDASNRQSWPVPA